MFTGWGVNDCYEVRFLHRGTHHEFAWLVCTDMPDDPMDLYNRLPKLQRAARKKLLAKVKLKSDGHDLPRNQGKVLDHNKVRFFSFKDLSTQTRFLAVHTQCKYPGNKERSLYLLISGIEGKKGDEIPVGHLNRAANRWREIEPLLNQGRLKFEGW